jgi:hypothetical protein
MSLFGTFGNPESLISKELQARRIQEIKILQDKTLQDKRRLEYEQARFILNKYNNEIRSSPGVHGYGTAISTVKMIDGKREYINFPRVSILVYIDETSECSLPDNFEGVPVVVQKAPRMRAL